MRPESRTSVCGLRNLSRIPVAAFRRAEMNYSPADDFLQRAVDGHVGTANGVLLEHGRNRCGCLGRRTLHGPRHGPLRLLRARPQPLKKMDHRPDHGNRDHQRDQESEKRKHESGTRLARPSFTRDRELFLFALGGAGILERRADRTTERGDHFFGLLGVDSVRLEFQIFL